MTADVAVIGGGAIGTAITYYLAKQGVKVILLEGKDICGGTSSACDKAVSMQTKNPGLPLEMALDSVKMYQTLAEELEHDIEFEQCGGMIPIENEAQLAIMRPFIERQKSIGLAVDLLDIDAARRIQPAFSPHLAASTFSPMDGRVNPLQLTFGFARAAKRCGAIIRTGAAVQDIVINGGTVDKVVTSAGTVDTRVVVNAAGVWAPFIGKMAGLDIPIKPRRGQILVTETVPKDFVRTEVWSARYIVAKHNVELIRREDPAAAELGIGLSVSQSVEGYLLIGATREFAGYDTHTTPEALASIIRHATSILPGLKNVHIIRTFAGLRPYTPDGMAILGPVEEVQGFIMAAGHEGDGIALAPVTGKMIADYIVSGAETRAIRELGLGRFAGTDGQLSRPI
ncbi:MAG: FAD-dependent oxidoreductase [Negativicutes bacterium]|nr:FAD-dependent oxidoreductase [Negativicutes bacterium]